MIRELELARGRIEQIMLEHAARCEQLDVVRCEIDHDLMVYAYTTSGDCFPVLIELQEDIGCSREYIVDQIWPRLAADLVH